MNYEKPRFDTESKYGDTEAKGKKDILSRFLVNSEGVTKEEEIPKPKPKPVVIKINGVIQKPKE